MIQLHKCPVCGCDLHLNNGSYICSNDNCNILIIDNHIMTMQTIVGLFENTEEDNTEDKLEMSTKAKKVVVMNKMTAEMYSLESHDKVSIIISITSKGSNEAFIIPNRVANIKDVLKIQFNDEDSTDENFGGISYQEAKQIADFVRKYKDNSEVDTIIVQCEAGQSRSAGVAGAILKYLYDDDTQIFGSGKYTPNMLCYRRVYESLMFEE